jgi:ATP-binding protein involved in chromosome partitioning
VVGGGEMISTDLHLPFLGRIPLDSRICEDSDQGLPFIIKHSDFPASTAFMAIVDRIEEFLRKK